MPAALSYSAKGPRQINQDYILSSEFDDKHSIFIVSDGIGGYEYGEIAAEVAAASVSGFFSAKPDLISVEETLHKLSIQICLKLMAKASELKCVRLGTTIAAAYFFDNHALLFWIGDTRIYHYRNGQLLFQSTDHSMIYEMKAGGSIITPFIRDQYSHIVTRSLSNEKVVLFDFEQTTLNQGDHIIICSDGVHNIVPESMLINLVNTQPLSLQPLVEYCTDQARDNFSIIVINI